jgi:hypothetical protein
MWISYLAIGEQHRVAGYIAAKGRDFGRLNNNVGRWTLRLVHIRILNWLLYPWLVV